MLLCTLKPFLVEGEPMTGHEAEGSAKRKPRAD
jgi:hypothetical protein